MKEISTDLDIYKRVRGGLKTTKQLLFLPHFPKLNKFVKEYGKENKQTEFHLKLLLFWRQMVIQYLPEDAEMYIQNKDMLEFITKT